MDESLVTRAKVEILGRQYTLKGDVDPEYMQSLARYVNSKLEELKKLAPEMEPLRLALLMSLNLADELFQSRKEQGILGGSDLEKIHEKTLHLISMLEEGLIGED